MISIILGAGEIGQAYFEILRGCCEVYRQDIRADRSDDIPEKPCKMLHVCLRYSDDFIATVEDAMVKHRPEIVNVMTTCPPGTTAQIGRIAVHSTTRGLHPHLKSGILAAKKHIGGPRAQDVAEYFRRAGIDCITHKHAKTTELAHIASNALYGVQIMFAQELDRLCRNYGVDYFEAVELYNMTHNEAYDALGFRSKFRPILHPPGDKIGGHCVAQGAALIPQELRGEMMDRLANFNAHEKNQNKPNDLKPTTV